MDGISKLSRKVRIPTGPREGGRSEGLLMAHTHTHTHTHTCRPNRSPGAGNNPSSEANDGTRL